MPSSEMGSPILPSLPPSTMDRGCLGGAHTGDLGHGGSQGCGPEWDNGNGGSHRSPLLEHHRRASGGRSRVCLRAEFVLKRFIISLTGRFPVSVLVNNCSQLNVHKICIAGVWGVGGTRRISCQPAPGTVTPWGWGGCSTWHGDGTGVGWGDICSGRCTQSSTPFGWDRMGIALLHAPQLLLCSIPLHSLPSLRCIQALPGNTSPLHPMHHPLIKHFSLYPDARPHPTWAETAQLSVCVTSGAFSKRRGREPRLSVRQLEKQPKGRKKGTFWRPHLHRSLKLPKCGVWWGGSKTTPRAWGGRPGGGTPPFSKANNHSLG